MEMGSEVKSQRFLTFIYSIQNVTGNMSLDEYIDKVIKLDQGPLQPSTYRINSLCPHRF